MYSQITLVIDSKNLKAETPIIFHHSHNKAVFPPKPPIKDLMLDLKYILKHSIFIIIQFLILKN